MHMYVYMYICISMCIHICVYVYTYIHKYIYVHTYLYMINSGGEGREEAHERQESLRKIVDVYFDVGMKQQIRGSALK